MSGVCGCEWIADLRGQGGVDIVLLVVAACGLDLMQSWLLPLHHVSLIDAHVKIIDAFACSWVVFLSLRLRPIGIPRKTASRLARRPTRLLRLTRRLNARRVHRVADLFAIFHVIFCLNTILVFALFVLGSFGHSLATRVKEARVNLVLLGLLAGDLRTQSWARIAH